MKYVVVVGDGMPDYPVPELNNKTPLQAAKKPNIDHLAKYAEVGMVRTVPDGITPGSDVANLAVLGYDPVLNYTGRSPLEAMGMDIAMSDEDVAFRCNLVTLSDEEDYNQKTLLDYCSGEIPSEDARVLIDLLNDHFRSDTLAFHPGISYRHCMMRKGALSGCHLTPPHDIINRKISEYLPKGENGEFLLDMMRESYRILHDHPINQARMEKGLNPANAIWLWGEGRKPGLPFLQDKYYLKGSMISAVDLLKGIAKCAGMRSVDVPGATGNIDTNFLGKADAALHELETGQDFVYIHIEAPDECGHRHEIENKVRSIELIDEKVIAPLIKGMEQFEDYKIMVIADHPTPLSLRTHTVEPVPFLIYQRSRPKLSGVDVYDEFSARDTQLFFPSGASLMDHFISLLFSPFMRQDYHSERILSSVEEVK